MDNARKLLLRWGPAVLWMGVIFAFSATPGKDLPEFGSIDYILKKSGHLLEYAVLALAFRRALQWDRRQFIAAWYLAVGYALLDEWHQSFVAGRHPSLVDAFGFDAAGAALALWISGQWPKASPGASRANIE